jgi:repressor LexA
MLTKKQKELFVYLKDYISSNEISPSFEEMKNAVNLKSKSGIHRLITSLEQRGYIKRLKHKARVMEIAKDFPNRNTNQIMVNNNDSFVNIPLIGSIAAGEAIEAINSSDSMISIPKSLVTKNSTYFGLKVKGLSMIDEGIFDGDIAIIKKTNAAENGKIAAVLTLDNEITLKKIKVTNQKIFLIPANKAYDIKEHNIGDVQIQGTLSGIIRKYN